MNKYYSWHRDSKYRYLFQEIEWLDGKGWQESTELHSDKDNIQKDQKKTSKGDFEGEAVIELSQEWKHRVNGILKCPEFLWALLCPSAEYPYVQLLLLVSVKH